MGQKPAPHKVSPKTTSPPRVRGEMPTLGSQYSLHTLGGNQETLGYSFDTKKSGNSFCLKRVKTAILFRRISLYVFFLPKYSLSSQGGNSRFL